MIPGCPGIDDGGLLYQVNCAWWQLKDIWRIITAALPFPWWYGPLAGAGVAIVQMLVARWRNRP